jgi:hypothetical protein
MMKSAFHLHVAIGVLCLAKIANAQSPIASPASVNQPVLTYVLDTEQHVRPVIGVVGAASVGAAVDVGFDISQVAVPAMNNYVLAMTDGNWPTVLAARNGSLTPATPLQPGPWIDRVALSPSGSAAVFLSSSQHRIYAYTGLSKLAISRWQIDLEAVDPVSAIAISDDGRNVAIGTFGGQYGALFIATPGHHPRLIGAMRHPVAIAFLHNSANAVVADDVDNAIYSLSNGQIARIAATEDGISSPGGLGISNDNQRVFVANLESESISVIGPDGNIAAPVPCKCTLTGLYPTNADSVFRLTDFSGSPILLFDANRAEPRITFVPVSSSQF